MRNDEVAVAEFQSASTPESTTVGRPLVIVTSLFFMWGFLTSLNDILVPHLKSVFDLTYTRVMLVQSAFFSAYFLFSLPWAKVVNTIGYQKSMIVGLSIMSVGALLFVPAASTPSFVLFLAALTTLATGITGLQVAANPYVIVLGSPDGASSRLNLTQAFNSLGTTLAPILGGILILSVSPLPMDPSIVLSPESLRDYRVREAASVKLPYIAISAALALLAVAIGRANLPEVRHAAGVLGKTNGSIWTHRNLVLGAFGIFVYVGAEVAIGSFLVNYMSQAHIANFPAQTAAGYVAFYWGGAMLGRFIGAAALRRVETRTLLAFCALFSTALITVSLLTTGYVAMWSMIAVGLFNSVMFPSIFALGVAGLGPLTGTASGVLSMAIAGGAVVPVIQGALADSIGVQRSFFLPAICYLYIIFYALKGATPDSTRYVSDLKMGRGSVAQ